MFDRLNQFGNGARQFGNGARQFGNGARAPSGSTMVNAHTQTRGPYGTPSFRFVVEISGRDGRKEKLGAFTDCKLPMISWKTQEVKEGGLNTHTHLLIGPRKKAKLSPKRGIAVTSHLLEWYNQILRQQVVRKEVSIYLYDYQKQPVVTWTIYDAYPIKWKGPKLKTKSKTIAIETLELACGFINIE